MLIAALSAAALLAAQAQSSQQPTAVDDVVVSARPLDQQVRSFLDDVAVPDRNLRVARWNRDVCVGVVSMRTATAQYLADRVSEIGMDIGLDPGEPGCKPNILIMAATDSAELATGLVEAYPRLFNPGGSGMVRTRAALRRFQSDNQPIRWWQVSLPVDNHTGKVAVRMPGEEPPVTTGTASRLRTEIRNDISRVIIVLDIPKLEGLDMKQVADYAAMVAYSQVDPDADFGGYDTILALDSNRDVRGITDWDMAYLRALYSAELTSVSKTQQLGEIARLMEMRQIRSQEDTRRGPAGS